MIAPALLPLPFACAVAGISAAAYHKRREKPFPAHKKPGSNRWMVRVEDLRRYISAETETTGVLDPRVERLLPGRR